MAEQLYEQYARLLGPHVVVTVQALIGVVRSAVGDLSSQVMRHFRSLVSPRRPPAITGAGPSSSHIACQQLTLAQEAARHSEQCQLPIETVDSDKDSNEHQPAGMMTDDEEIMEYESDTVQVKEEDQEENELRFVHNSNNQGSVHDGSLYEESENIPDGNIETVDSDKGSNEHHSAGMLMDDEENFADESQDEPAITVVNYEEEYAQFIDNSHNQDSILDGPLGEEPENVSQRQESGETVNFHMNNSNEDDNEYSPGQEVLDEPENSTEASNQPNQTGPSIVSNPTLTRRLTRASASKKISDSETIENSANDQQQQVALIRTGKRKRSKGRRSGKLTAQKRTRFVPAPTAAAAEVDHDDNEHTLNQEVPDYQENGTEANYERDQAGPSTVSNPVSTVTRRSTRAVRKVTLQTGTGKRKLNNNVPVPKRLRVQPAVVEEDDEEASEDEAEEEALSLSVTVVHLKCPETGCKTKCPSKKRLNQHLLAKHQIQRFRCRVAGCTASFARQPELTDHRKLAHRKLKNWPCAHCETICKEYNVLTNHLLDHHEEGEFACTAHRCNYTDKTRKRVRNHQLKHRDSKYKCTFAGCNLSCYNKTDFTRHLRAHRKEKPFGCGQCNKAFTNKSDLTTHERIHSGLKPYHCKWPGCTYSASDCSNAHGHVRLVHFGLPKSKKEQLRRRIVDDRKASEFIEKVTE